MHELVSQVRVAGGLPTWQKELRPDHELGGIHDWDAAETLAEPHRYDYRLEEDGVARPRLSRPSPEEGTRWLATIYHQPVRPALNYTRLPAPDPPSLGERLGRALTRWLGWDRDLLAARDERS